MLCCPSAEHSAHVQEEREKRELIKNIRQQVKSFKKMISSSRVVVLDDEALFMPAQEGQPDGTSGAGEEEEREEGEGEGEDLSAKESFNLSKLGASRVRAMVSILLPRSIYVNESPESFKES